MIEFTASTTPTVMLADADEALSAATAAQLREHGLAVINATSGDGALSMVEDSTPDVLLLDPSMTTSSGEELLVVLRAETETEDELPVIVLTSDDPAVIQRGRALGAHDHLGRSFHEVTLLARVEAAIQIKRLRNEVRRQNDTLRRLTRVDGLTGLMNRAQMETQLTQTAATAERHSRALSVILMDIDRFSRINDAAGNEAGDMVLQDVARHVMSDIRTGDAAARWDGDQFLLLLPETPLTGAAVLAERLRETISDFGAQLPDGSTRPISASFGCAEGVSASEMLQRASTHLVAAKKQGGNSVKR